jgi:hypothetical protein
MKRILMAIMAVTIAVTFSAPSFADEKKKDEKKGGKFVEMISADEKKKEDKKGGHADTFADEKKKDEKKGGK